MAPQPTPFTGQFPYQVDDRNRVPVPPPFRVSFRDGGYLSPGTGDFLVLHTPESFAQASEFVERFPEESDDGNDIRRDFYSNTYPVQLDGQGRVVIDRGLSALVGLSRNVLVVGTGRRLEIWDQTKWDALQAARRALRHAAFNAQRATPGGES